MEPQIHLSDNSELFISAHESSAETQDFTIHEGQLIEEIESCGQIVNITPDFNKATHFQPTSVAFCNDDLIDSPILVQEAEISELIGKIVRSEKEAFDVYNDYAFRIGFGIRYSTLRKGQNGLSIRGREFCCNKEGKKQIKGSVGKKFTKVDRRTECEAKVYFEYRSNGDWVLVRHLMQHNHSFCPSSLVHHVRSHRDLSHDQLSYLNLLKKQGVKVADAFRCLRAEAGGSPAVGFALRDAYNNLAKEAKRCFDGTDANTLVKYFRQRQRNKEDFFFAFEVDFEGSLVSYFWRDKQMKEDYCLFGDLIVHDTTYRTNKYEMICGPFVGVNNHTHNCMFGCGFLLNERIESFEWLFHTFLEAMGGQHPKTIMTDQSFSMSSAISSAFPNSQHRLCIWHISENSKKHIRDLRNQDGFLDLFDRVLKFCHTIPEFEYYWNRLVTEYSCANNDWLKRLYTLREKWCPAFSKDYFSAGILSSQRSESTNHALSRKVTVTATLCDFYHFFCETVSEWRSHERIDNQRCWEGFPEIAIPHVSLLYRASRVYTIDAYMLFEKEFMKSLSLKHELKHSDGSLLRYLVHVPTDNMFPYFVLYDASSDSVSCTCKHFEEAGILCSHILRIYHIHCVENIPGCYILKRWTRNAKSFVESHSASCSRFAVLPSVWRLQMQRKVNKLLSSCDSNEATRGLCEEAFTKLRVDVEAHVGSIYFSDTDSVSIGEDAINNPKGSRNKGERNVRRKSVSEIKTNQARARKRAVHRSTSTCSVEPPSSVGCSSLLDT